MDSPLVLMFWLTVAMTITLGSNNMTVAASAANHCLRANWPHAFDMALCSSLLMLLRGDAAVGSRASFHHAQGWRGLDVPDCLENRDRPPSDARPMLGSFDTIALQWINLKAWMIGVGVASQFMPADMPLAGQVARIGLVFLLASLVPLFWED